MKKLLIAGFVFAALAGMAMVIIDYTRCNNSDVNAESRQENPREYQIGGTEGDVVVAAFASFSGLSWLHSDSFPKDVICIAAKKLLPFEKLSEKMQLFMLTRDLVSYCSIAD